MFSSSVGRHEDSDDDDDDDFIRVIDSGLSSRRSRASLQNHPNGRISLFRFLLNGQVVYVIFPLILVPFKIFCHLSPDN